MEKNEQQTAYVVFSRFGNNAFWFIIFFLNREIWMEHEKHFDIKLA